MDRILGRMTITIKSALLIVIMAVVALIIAVLSYDGLMVSERHGETMRNASERATYGERANGLVMSVVSDSRGIYMSADSQKAEKFAVTLMAALDKLGETMAAWERAVPEAQRADFVPVMAKAQEFIAFRSELVRLGQTEGPAAARAYGDNEANRANRKAFNDQLEKLAVQNAAAVEAGVDAMRDFHDGRVLLLLGVAAAGILLGLAAAGVVAIAGIGRPLGRISGAMETIAAGTDDVTVPGTDRRDEVGVMARALEVLRGAQATARRLGEERERAQVERLKRAEALERRIQGFDREVVAILSEVDKAIRHLQETAGTMSGLADDLRGRAGSSAAAAEETSANVQTVAAAAEEMAGTLREISNQVVRSTDVAAKASAQAEGADQTIQSLAEAAGRIGDLVRLIEDIAGQTNLLALNATIEAARAGDAGKGFAVVAGEVKSLAGQTGKATADIAAQISAIQAATERSVEAFRAIGGTIDNINEISTTIASAVEEQTAATGEIARNVQQAAVGSQEVSTTVSQVNRAADDTGSAARSLAQATDLLSAQAGRLRHDIDAFLTDMRNQSLSAA